VQSAPDGLVADAELGGDAGDGTLALLVLLTQPAGINRKRLACLAERDPGAPGSCGEDGAVEAGLGGDHVEVLAVLQVFTFEEFPGEQAAGLLVPLACRGVAAAAR
jgi:hypothetical protein